MNGPTISSTAAQLWFWNLLVCLSSLITGRLPLVLQRFEGLLRLSGDRRVSLEDQLSLHVFEREAKELQTWLTSKKTAVESKDCGQDLEDVEVTEESPPTLVVP